MAVIALRRDDRAVELREDLGELLSLARSARRRLRRARAEVTAARRALGARVYRTQVAQLRSAEEAYARYITELDEILARPHSESRLTAFKRDYACLLRMQQGVAAALVTSSDWQSPAHAAAGGPGFGRRSGITREHVDDYKRDRHADAAEFEAAYLRAMVDAPDGGVRALMTACGMAAFTTVLQFLISDRAVRGAVALGRSTYHECRDLLLSSSLADVAVVVPDGGPSLPSVLDGIPRLGAVFVDAFANARGLAVPDVDAVLNHLDRTVDEDVYVVIDSTCLPGVRQPFARPAPNPCVRVVVFESLTKFAQMGFDRTAAGMIVAEEREAKRLDHYREHLGTNIADAVVWALPEPDRQRLDRRLKRIERNALHLATILQEHIESHPGPVTGVCYPGLEGHESHATAARLPFWGGFLALEFDAGHDTTEVHSRVVELALGAARRRAVDLVAGASFGFDETRIYRTATESRCGPFVRIAPGTEHLCAITAVGKSLCEALDRLAAA